jgi:hypothetical protein
MAESYALGAGFPPSKRRCRAWRRQLLTKPDVHRVTNIDLTYARVQVIYNFDQKSLPTNAPDRWPLRVQLERIRKRRFDPFYRIR